MRTDSGTCNGVPALLRYFRLLVTLLCAGVACLGHGLARALPNPCVSSYQLCTSGTCDNSCMDYVKDLCTPPVSFTKGLTNTAFCARFGNPVSPPKMRLSTGGILQDFEFGQIATYSSWASSGGKPMPGFVLRASRSRTDGRSVSVDWNSTAPYSYEFFKVHITLDNEKADKSKEVHVQQFARSGSLPLSMDNGHGTYIVEVEGCDYPDTCPQGRSNPVNLDYLPLMSPKSFGLFPGPSPPGAPPGTGPDIELFESVPLKALPPPALSTGQLLDVPDPVVMPYVEVAPLMKGYCAQGLHDTNQDDTRHNGELSDDVLVAQLGLLQAGDFCQAPDSTDTTEFSKKIDSAIVSAIVKSHAGTDVGKVAHVAAVTAVGAAIGLLILALVTNPLNLVFGSMSPLLSAVVFAVSGGLLGAALDLATYQAGDYDMRLLGLVRTYYEFGYLLDKTNTTGKTPAKDRLADLLTVRGPASERKEQLHILKLPTPVPETENHLWMTETSRYLTNNILAKRLKDAGQPVPKELDNDKNGMTAYLLQRLQDMLVRDSYEENGRPYERLTFAALVNLADFASAYSTQCLVAPPPGAPAPPTTCDVARAARNGLDFQAAKFAAGTNQLRRAAPFRRRSEFSGYPRMWTTGGDDLTWRHFGLLGGSDTYVHDRYYRMMDGSEGMLIATYQATWRPPVMVTDLMRFPDGSPGYLQTFHATERGTNVVEVYSRTPDYLISAGGRFEPGTGFVNNALDDIDAALLHLLKISGGEEAWTQPTTLMPTMEGGDLRDFVRIEGHTDATKRFNTCVAPGFACGVNPKLPAGLPEACQIHSGNWTFINFNAGTSACPFRYGYYAVFYKQSCAKDDACKSASGEPADGGSFGFFEAVPAGMWDFPLFPAAVLAQNGTWKFEFGKVNEYSSPYYQFGKTVFQLSDDSTTFPVISHGPTSAPTMPIRRLALWPIASGTLMTAPKRGCVYIDNARLNERLILDHINVSHPMRALVKRNTECNCPLSLACLNPRAR